MTMLKYFTMPVKKMFKKCCGFFLLGSKAIWAKILSSLSVGKLPKFIPFHQFTG